MAGYRDELERLNFSAEEKEALTCLCCLSQISSELV